MYSFIHQAPLLVTRFSRHQTGRCPRRPTFKLRQRCPSMLATNLPDEGKLLDQLLSVHQPTQILALIALPQLSSEKALSVLHSSDLLNSSNRQVRLTAVSTLGKLGVLSQAPKLLSVLTDMEDDYSVRAAAASALGELLSSGAGGATIETVGETVTALLHTATEDNEFIVRYASLVSLGNIRSPAALPLLIATAKNVTSPTLEAIAAVAAIGEIVSPENVDEDLMEVITGRAADQEDLVRAAVVKTLGQWRDKDSAKAALEQMEIDESKYGNSPIVLTVLANALGKYE